MQYDREGKKVLKYDGYRYKFSPYALVWNMDSYFVIGCYERKDNPKIIKFRIDKICSIQILDEDRIPCPDDFDLSAFCDSMFLMYGDEKTDVTLSCEYSVMNKVIDRFGEDITITPGEDDDHFQITEQVMACSTFYSWIFNYGGKIKIVAPEKVKREFDELLHKFD
ncbi:MAG: WYL domain-containing protein [Clostridia bacterium]|nr:WYL domain-containing protein [Clostridia bacterium]